MANRKSDLKHNISPEKAKKILEEGEIRGQPLTEKQEGFFGARAGPARPSRSPREK